MQYSPVVTGRSGRILAIAGRPAPARGPVTMFASVHVMDPALLDTFPAYGGAAQYFAMWIVSSEE